MTDVTPKKTPKPKLNTQPTRVFDVSKPGVGPASTTSRPIIVGHAKAIEHDPMVVEETPTEDIATEPELIDVPKQRAARKEMTIEPVSVSEDKAPTDSAVPEQESNPDSESAQPEDSTSELGSEAKADDQSINSESAVVDAILDGVDPGNDVPPLEDPAEKGIEKLIASRKYYVKTSLPSGQRNKLWLLVLLIVLAAAAGWYILLGPGKDLLAPSTTASVPVVVDPVPVAPAAPQPTTKEFSDVNVGLSFTYPASWGDAKMTDNTSISSEKGRRVLIEFSKNTSIIAGMKASDWRKITREATSNCKDAGFTAFLLQKTQKGNGLTVLTEQPDYQVYEQLGGGLCNDLEMIANKKFTANKVYTGFQIWYQARVEDKLDLAQRIADYDKQPDKYFTKQLRDEITTVIQSVKEL